MKINWSRNRVLRSSYPVFFPFFPSFCVPSWDESEVLIFLHSRFRRKHSPPLFLLLFHSLLFRGRRNGDLHCFPLRAKNRNSDQFHEWIFVFFVLFAAHSSTWFKHRFCGEFRKSCLTRPTEVSAGRPLTSQEVKKSFFASLSLLLAAIAEEAQKCGGEEEEEETDWSREDLVRKKNCSPPPKKEGAEPLKKTLSLPPLSAFLFF